jgi:hypothetical protein
MVGCTTSVTCSAFASGVELLMCDGAASASGIAIKAMITSVRINLMRFSFLNTPLTNLTLAWSELVSYFV